MPIQVTNTQRGPISLMVRSRNKNRSFTTLVLPGRGAGQNSVVIEDERLTEQIERAEAKGLITTRTLATKKS